MILRYYRTPALSTSKSIQVLRLAQALGANTQGVGSEDCYYVESVRPLSKKDRKILRFLMGGENEPDAFGEESFTARSFPIVIEVGPRLNFETPWSSTAVTICERSGIKGITRFERSRRIGFSGFVPEDIRPALEAALHDRMTETVYPGPLRSFESGLVPAPVRTIPILERPSALRKFNSEQGCGWDKDDLAMIMELFRKLGCNPTDVELFQIAQANSDHSRHWFFRGKLIIDGEPIPEKNLMEIIKAPLRANPGNSVIAFCDDSSAIRGYEVTRLAASNPVGPGELIESKVLLHPTLTAETHNFPTGVAPFPGAATGTGGRIRDNQAVGRGGLYGAGSAIYMTGNLHIPGYDRPWEADDWSHPDDLASPLDILIEASNGTSAYGNCHGEPLIYGGAREAAVKRPDDSYTAYYKPVMFTSGAGAIDDRHTEKGKPEEGMLVIQVGGPAYRIGMGGSAASSMEQGANKTELDLNAVQRGNPEMEQRMNRFVRACIELGDKNPLVSAHDLGAGGDSNALPEIVDPVGARINLRALPVGDQTLSVLEIWGNESQERNAFLAWPESFDLLRSIGERENVEVALVGQVTGDGYLVLFDETDGSTPVNLPLAEVLGQLEAKTFRLETVKTPLAPLVIPADLTFPEALRRVLSLVSVGSKRFLTNKVDRSVTGLVAQQQCCGPHHTPVSDFALLALSYRDKVGQALSLGEQPMIGLIDPAAGARMTLAEAILNLAGVKITQLSDIKAEANWMLAAKKPGEGAKLVQAARALSQMAIQLGIAFDGGKDSSSMASRGTAPNGESGSVKAPLTLVVAPYAPVEDITKKVTPDLKKEGSYLLHLPLTALNRLGGSALAQVLGQLGDECPDIEDTGELVRVFLGEQRLLERGLISAVHDISGGGLIVTLLEMAMAGNKGLIIDLQGKDLFASYFAEEAGLVIETTRPADVAEVLSIYQVPEIRCVGQVCAFEQVAVNFNGERVLTTELPTVRSWWEKTSARIEELQTNPACARKEHAFLSGSLPDPGYRLTFKPGDSPGLLKGLRPKAAILREEGSNGDREMAAAFKHAGFKAWDITMTDLATGRASLRDVQLIALVGGFSFGDVLDSGKGWVSVIRHNPKVEAEFAAFFARPDTLSLGVCNGCQVMALLGIPGYNYPDEQRPRFITNLSERFESRFPTVEVMPSPAIWFEGMVGSRLGIWVAHGEGRIHAAPNLLSQIESRNLVPLRYVDNQDKVTEDYPFNPNGSPGGITALCSTDGRHLAMMPHPERVFLPWQWPWQPQSWKDLEASPWLRFFQNAFTACS